jgi:2-methylisocitrate lyase-like PEP mutase family enzyme
MPSSPPAQRNLAADAAKLRALHVPGTPLLLANVWDPTSAQAVAAAGLPAIATASAVGAKTAFKVRRMIEL